MKHLIAILGAICTLSTLSAEIQSTPNLDPVYEEILNCDSNTLFLIDVGGTLLIHKDPIFHASHTNWRREWFRKHYPNLTAEEKFSLVRAIETDTRSWTLYERDWPILIGKAQERKIKTAAFTKCFVDDSINHLRLDWLKSFGLHFYDDLKELPYQNELFVYIDGVIQTDQNQKGPVLKEVVSKLKEHPRRVVFVDDRIAQLKSVEEACKEMNIPFIGFHYTAFEETPYLDEAIAHEQLDILVKEHRWVTLEDFPHILPIE